MDNYPKFGCFKFWVGILFWLYFICRIIGLVPQYIYYNYDFALTFNSNLVYFASASFIAIMYNIIFMAILFVKKDKKSAEKHCLFAGIWFIFFITLFVISSITDISDAVEYSKSKEYSTTAIQNDILHNTSNETRYINLEQQTTTETTTIAEITTETTTQNLTQIKKDFDTLATKYNLEYDFIEDEFSATSNPQTDDNIILQTYFSRVNEDGVRLPCYSIFLAIYTEDYSFNPDTVIFAIGDYRLTLNASTDNVRNKLVSDPFGKINTIMYTHFDYPDSGNLIANLNDLVYNIKNNSNASVRIKSGSDYFDHTITPAERSAIIDLWNMYRIAQDHPEILNDYKK